MNDAPAIVTDDPDTIIRCQWTAGRPADAIREDLGGVRIGVVGERVRGLGLPARNHKREMLPGVMLDRFDPELGSTKHLNGTERCPQENGDPCVCGLCGRVAEA